MASVDDEAGAGTTGLPVSSQWRFWVLVAMGVMGLAMIFAMRFVQYVGVDVIAEGERTVYRSSPWWMPLTALPLLGFFVIGLLVITVRHTLARVLGAFILVMAVYMSAVMISCVLTHQVVVTPDGFSQTIGFGWSPETRQVEFAQAASLSVVPTEISRGKQRYEVVSHLLDDSEVRMYCNPMLKAALPEIAERARARGVEVNGDF